MMKIVVETESRLVTEGVPDDPDDRWSYHSPNVYESSVVEVRVAAEEDYTEFEVPEGTGAVWVVWVRYSDGDTFGSSQGMIQVVEVFTEYSLAEEFAKAIRELDRSNRIASSSDILTDYFIYGTGYFGTVEDVYVERFEVGFDPAAGKVRF